MIPMTNLRLLLNTNLMEKIEVGSSLITGMSISRPMISRSLKTSMSDRMTSVITISQLSLFFLNISIASAAFVVAVTANHQILVIMEVGKKNQQIIRFESALIYVTDIMFSIARTKNVSANSTMNIQKRYLQIHTLKVGKEVRGSKFLKLQNNIKESMSFDFS